MPELSVASEANPTGPRISMQLGIKVCREHAIDDAASYVTDAGWQMICMMITSQGYATPDRGTLKVTYKVLS